jgi:hypothetical protein
MAERPKAFFASPFNPDFRWVRNAVAEACRYSDVEFRAVDEAVAPGESIIDAIHYEIQQCTFGIATISGLNPNVMYELGLLHQASKPTIILSDPDTLAKPPFDIRSLMIVRYDTTAKKEDELVTVVRAAISGLLRLLDPQSRAAVAAGEKLPIETTSFAHTVLSFHEIDFSAIKSVAAKQVERKNCETRNINEYEDDHVKGWRLRARCAGGYTLIVIIDLNGKIRSVDIES